MVNPVLTILFNLFLVGSALTIVAAMAQEYFDSRRGSVGGRQPAPGPSSPPSSAATLQARQRRALRKAA